jgi:GDPmannose 4,6-dehydratase
MKKALITGISGQTGSYLAEYLLEKGYEVHGIVRRNSSSDSYYRIECIKDDISLHYGDMTDKASLYKIIGECEPDAIYNMAAMSHVGLSFKIPEYTLDVDGKGVLHILEVMKDVVPKSRFYQASTSELFGKSPAPQSEKTNFHPRSPYGVAKLAAYWSVVNYRESYGIFASNGILFNHESSRRGENFVTRKITKAVAKIKYGMQNFLELGNIDAKRDWGYAKDYCEAIYMIANHHKPDDFVIATGEHRSVREFLHIAFEHAGMDIESNGKEGVEEEFVRKSDGITVVKINPEFYRPAEVDNLLGDWSKAKNELGWRPKTSFSELVSIMVDYDLSLIKKDI